jgi:hypothetical protein
MEDPTVREDELAFAPTEYPTVPLPVPLLPDVTVNQEAPLLAVQRHGDCVLTLTVSVPPDAVKTLFGGEIEYVHVLALASFE